MSTDPLLAAREIMKQQAREAGQPITERWHNHSALDICVPSRCPAGATKWDGSGLVSDHFTNDADRAPLNTPDAPRDAPDDAPCQAQSASPPFGACEHERRYEVVIYQVGTHEWIRLFACVPCAATLRNRHHRLGPGGTEGIARMRDASAA